MSVDGATVEGMNTATNYLTVLVLLLVLVAPSLYGIARDRRIDRQLRQAERR